MRITPPTHTIEQVRSYMREHGVGLTAAWRALGARSTQVRYDHGCNHHGPGEHCGTYLLHGSCPHTRGEGS